LVDVCLVDTGLVDDLAAGLVLLAAFLAGVDFVELGDFLAAALVLATLFAVFFVSSALAFSSFAFSVTNCFSSVTTGLLAIFLGADFFLLAISVNPERKCGDDQKYIAGIIQSRLPRAMSNDQFATGLV
jgi:hypothetical protein